MNLIITLAIGEQRWGQMALNLALSIKANTPNQKILLIHEPSSVKGIEELIEKYFDYSVLVNRTYQSAPEYAFYTKTQLYKIATESAPEATNFIFLDADTIMLPSKSVNDWFEKHEQRIFTAYCNDIYDFKTKSRKRRDYTFWCEPETAKKEFGISDDSKMPQINSSFIYFQKSEKVKEYFEVASKVWDNDECTYLKYKNVKPDEYCFNIVSAITGLLPHQNTYRPIFFQFGSEQQSWAYISEYYKSFGFAGNIAQGEHLIKMYNDLSDYYRKKMAIIMPFKFNDENAQPNYLPIKPTKRRTLLRKGEVPNSNGGIFNPSALLSYNGLTIAYRKESDFDGGMYIGKSSICHIQRGTESFELESNAPANIRLEDFRLFEWGKQFYVSHTVCPNSVTSNAISQVGVSKIEGTLLNYIGIPNVTCKASKKEKNWLFFSENDLLFCIYSLDPYMVYYSTHINGKWFELDVKGKINWFHDSPICNSTNPILVDDHYLVWFHTKEKSEYFHGVCLINRYTKKIEYCTPKAIKVESGREGFNNKIIYVSGCVYLKDKDILRVYMGESDTHSITNDFVASDFIAELKKHKA